MNRLIDSLYEDHFQGRVSDNTFNRLMERYQKEQGRLETQMSLYDDMKDQVIDTKTNAGSRYDYASFLEGKNLLRPCRECRFQYSCL